MPLNELATWLLDKPAFQQRLDDIIIASLHREFPMLQSINISTSFEWGYLLLCGSLLVKLDTEASQRAALRIAEICLSSAPNAAHRAAAAVLLESMANQPSVTLAQDRGLVTREYVAELPWPLRQDHARRSLENVVIRTGGVILPVNKFQNAFWKAAKENDWISISAPTSAGKSFIIKCWIEDFTRNHPTGNIVYLVPTRALIQEVSRDLEQHFAKQNANHVSIQTLPNKGEAGQAKFNIYVFTQERFHILLNGTDESFRFQILVVDEAQKIGEGSRGVLLLQVIDEAVRRNENTKIIFASPYTENPEYLLSGSPQMAKKCSVARNSVTVIQNLLWATQQPRKSTLWNVSYRDGEKSLQLGNFTLPYRPSPESKRLSFVAYAMRNHQGGNIIYVNGPGDAEKTADQLMDLAEEYESVQTDSRIVNLVELVQKTIHPEYSLARTLKRGVAYHYGNMPLLVRSEIERLFSENVIPFLVCTSTLLEGVNLPCKVIFARGPQKGRGNTMEAQDFWNLAGRAGRWGKEFHGHIVCVDAGNQDLWDGGAPTHRVKSRIRSIVERVLSDPRTFTDYVKSGFPAAVRAESPEFDHVFGYLASAILRDGNLGRIWSTKSLDAAVVQGIETVLLESLQASGIPEELIRRNPGVLAYQMNRLLLFFGEVGPAIGQYVPVAPESEDAVATYEVIFGVIKERLGVNLGGAARLKSLAILTVQWMRGFPLARLIDARQRYADAHQPSVNLQQLIRNVMNDVEQFARFEAPRLLACYRDVLNLFAVRSGQTGLVSELPDLALYLEFGVSLPTQLALISLGLSRTSALVLSERIARDDLDREAVLAWLVNREWETLDIPELVKAEVRQVMIRHVAQGGVA
jgi:hypothetical protein